MQCDAVEWHSWVKEMGHKPVTIFGKNNLNKGKLIAPCVSVFTHLCSEGVDKHWGKTEVHIIPLEVQSKNESAAYVYKLHVPSRLPEVPGISGDIAKSVQCCY